MAIKRREDGKYTVTCRDETDTDRFAVRESEAEAEAFFILTARTKSCGVVPMLSFAGLCEWYGLTLTLAGFKHGQRTVRSLQLHAIPRFGDERIGDVNLGHLNRMRAAMITEGLAPTTANGVFGAIRSMYHRAHVAGRIAKNPISPEMGQPLALVRAQRHKLVYRRAPIVAPEENKFQLLRSVAPPHLRVAFDLMDDWVRYSEVAALPLDCIDLAARSVLIKQAIGVGRQIEPYPESDWRILALSPKSVASLRRFMFEMAHGGTAVSPGREGLLLPLLLNPEHPAELAHKHDIKDNFNPEHIYNRTVVTAIAKGMGAFEISRRFGRNPATINSRFHVAFRRRNARALVAPMNANLARLLA